VGGIVQGKRGKKTQRTRKKKTVRDEKVGGEEGFVCGERTCSEGDYQRVEAREGGDETRGNMGFSKWALIRRAKLGSRGQAIGYDTITGSVLQSWGKGETLTPAFGRKNLAIKIKASIEEKPDARVYSKTENRN